MTDPIKPLVHALRMEVLAEEGQSEAARRWLYTILEHNAENVRNLGLPYFEVVGSNLVFRRGD